MATQARSSAGGDPCTRYPSSVDGAPDDGVRCRRLTAAGLELRTLPSGTGLV
jgi:hypothetical protein